ncbi:MAG: T9SS type A sorting domain-containing protein, partial [Algicola sp.]|nr:T9SS type A sorting domain-containing protein [Algicola sp.]
MKKITCLLFCGLLTITYAQNINLDTFATGLSNPVNIKHAGDNRLFVVERDGYIQIVDVNGTVNSTPFLDIEDRVIDFGGEQGLLALAFHPNYTTNGFLYVNYIDLNGDTVISRFTRNSVNSADPNSEVILLHIPQPYSNHNGGDMHFGASDGYLYISTGDGGSGGDPDNRAQPLDNLLGKMLRIDVNVTAGQIAAGTTYLIPTDNPYVGNASALDEIWANGLRNPWKWSFDRSNGDMWIADVGQSAREEINRTTATTGGENYGWKCFEGTSVFSTLAECSTITHQTPVAEYDYGGSPFRCSITGGYRYRGTSQTGLQGLYFFADYCSNEIGYVQETSPNNFSLNFLGQFPGGEFVAFGEDINGELYVASLANGTIYRIVESTLSNEASSLSVIKMHPNPAKLFVNFDLAHLTDSINRIEVYDLQGKRVLYQDHFDQQLTTMSTKNLNSGLYIVEISDFDNQKS